MFRPQTQNHVIIDPQRMSAKGLSPSALRQALQAGNVVAHAGEIVNDNAVVPVTAGTFFANSDDIAELVVGVFGGKPVYLDDVAEMQVTMTVADIAALRARPQQRRQRLERLTGSPRQILRRAG